MACCTGNEKSRPRSVVIVYDHDSGDLLSYGFDEADEAREFLKKENEGDCRKAILINLIETGAGVLDVEDFT